MDEQLKPQSEPKAKRDPAMWIGILAVIINIITVSVYMYQADIMQEQQHVSAWPYVEWLPSYNEETYVMEVTNNGIGPAIIKRVDIQLDNRKIPNLDSLFVALVGTAYFPHLTSTLQNRVLPPGKSIRLFQINDAKWAGMVFAEMQKRKFTMSICYQSVYGDSWTSEGVVVTEGVCP